MRDRQANPSAISGHLLLELRVDSLGPFLSKSIPLDCSGFDATARSPCLSKPLVQVRGMQKVLTNQGGLYAFPSTPLLLLPSEEAAGLP